MKKLIPGFIIGLSVVLFYFPLVTGRVLFFGDNYNLFAPVKSYFAQEVKHGRLPLWTPDLFAGSPLLADLNFGLLSPLNLPFFFLPPLVALTISALIGVTLFGVGAYLWLIQRGESVEISIVTSILAMGSGSVVAALNNLSVLQTVAWLPWVVMYLEKGIRREEKRWFLLAGLVLAAAILGGHPQFVFGLIVGLPLYLILRFPTRWAPVVFGLITCGFAAAGLAAVQLSPFLELVQAAARPVGQLSYLGTGALPKLGLVRLALPWFFGVKNRGSSWAFLSELNMGLASTAGYLGIIPLILVGERSLAWISDRKKQACPSELVPAGLMLVLALGPATPLYQFWVRAVPLAGLFRNAEQYLFFWSFWLLPLMATGLAGLVGKESRATQLVFLIGGIACLLLGLWFGRLNRLTIPLINRCLLAKTPVAFQTVKLIWRQNLMIASFVLVSGGVVLWRAKRWRVWLVGVVAFLDLLFLGRGDLISAPWEKVRFPERVAMPVDRRQVRFISEADVKPYHDLSTYWNQYAVRPPFGASRVDREELATFRTFRSISSSLPVNLNLLYHLSSPDGYGSLVLSDYADWVGSSGAINSIDAAVLIAETPLARQLRNELGLGYMVTSGGGVESLDYDQSEAPLRRNAPFGPLSFQLGLGVSIISMIVSYWLWRRWA